jgi:RNA polymerase sigma factor (sigma-70 family)
VSATRAVGEQDLTLLVSAAIMDEPGAWETLVARFAGLIWATARGLGLDAADAADVSQTTWLRLAECLEDIRDLERIGGWLATTARNESLRMLRLARRQIPVDPFLDVCSTVHADDIDKDLLGVERDERIRRAFESLPTACQALLRILMADPSPSYAEVSEILEIPIGTIGPRRSRCLNRLRSKAGVWDQAGASLATQGER